MRILVTEQGGGVMKQISTDKYHDDIKKANSPVKKPKETEKQMEKNKEKNNMENLRVLEIKNKKLSIPKDIQEKYNEVRHDETSLLPKLHTNIQKSFQKEQPTMQNTAEDFGGTESTRENTEGPSSNQKNGNSMRNSSGNVNIMQSSYRIKDVITDETYAMMKNNITKEVNLKNKLASVVSINFRNPFLTPMTRINDIEASLRTKIKSDKSSIIQYLNTKEILSPKLVKKIAKYDEEKFERLNKICQRVSNNDIEEIERKHRINGIIENHHQTEIADYKKRMNEMEKEVSGIKSICDKYPKRDDREKYENLLYDMKKKHWDKRDFTRLMKKKHLKTEV